MAQVNITQAAKLAGVARTTLYNTYIKAGKITVSKDRSGHKCIDTSELLRVFGELQNGEAVQLDNTPERPTERPTEQTLTPETDQIEQAVHLAKLETENSMLKAMIDELKEQRSLDREQIQNLSTKLLEHKPQAPAKRWWQVLWK